MVKDSPSSATPQTVLSRLEPGRRDAGAAAAMGEFEWNRATDRFIVSERLSAITGIPAGVMTAHDGHTALDYIYPDDVASLAAQFEAVTAKGDRFEVQFRLIRPEQGDLIWVNLSSVLIRDLKSQIVKVIGVVRDITSRKAEEDQRRALTTELDHRVKNVLESVQALANQSARRADSLAVFLSVFSEKLDAMASAHTLLTSMRRRGAAIEHIVAAELTGMSSGRATWAGPGIALTPQATHTLTLALHEMATNALKFGALSVDAGRVGVTWRSTADGGFELVWTETGGPDVTEPKHRGFGMDLLGGTTGTELGGAVSLEFRPEGLRATVTGDAATVTEILAEPLAADGPFEPMPSASDPIISSASAAGAQARAEGHADIARLRVLIVDDSVLLTRELKKGFKALRAKVIGTASRIEEAEKFLKLDFDVAVLDADLKGQSIAPICQSLFDRDIPFVITVGGDEHLAPPKGFGAPTVRKPYTIDQLAAAICRSRDRG